MRRRDFIASLGGAMAMCPFAAHAQPSQRPSIDKRRLQANCAGIAYWNGYHQFLDWNSQNPNAKEMLFYAPPPMTLPDVPGMDGEEFTIRWKGKGNMTVDWLTTGHVPFRVTGPNEGTFKMGKQPNNTRYRVFRSDAADPVRDIQVFQTRYRANVDRGELINPDYVTIAKLYKRPALHGLVGDQRLQGDDTRGNAVHA
jgi:hypothetical protein